MKKYLVGDTNGTFLSIDTNERTTTSPIKAKVYNTIGDAMRACINYNRNAYTFRVIPHVN